MRLAYPFLPAGPAHPVHCVPSFAFSVSVQKQTGRSAPPCRKDKPFQRLPAQTAGPCAAHPEPCAAHRLQICCPASAFLSGLQSAPSKTEWKQRRIRIALGQQSAFLLQKKAPFPSAGSACPAASFCPDSDRSDRSECPTHQSKRSVPQSSSGQLFLLPQFPGAAAVFRSA